MPRTLDHPASRPPTVPSAPTASVVSPVTHVSTAARRWPVSATARRAGVLLACVLLAAYTGMRMPSTWTATLQAVSWQDGFRRRFLVGSVLYPLDRATGYAYAVFAAVSFLVLVALLVVVVVAAVRTRVRARWVLVAVWLVSPAGGYLFHEVGYFEQVLFLALFAAWWLVARGRWVLAASVMAASVCVHEIAMLTVVPLFTMIVVRALSTRRAIAAVAVPALVGVFVLTVTPAEDGAVSVLSGRLAGADFRARPDALEIFGRSQTQSMGMYRPLDVLWFLVPLVLVLGTALVFTFAGGRVVVGSRRVVAIGAALAPASAAFAGWDMHRWAFLLLGNSAVVLWWWLGQERPTGGAARSRCGVWVAVVLVCTHVPLAYFDGYAPRDLTGRAIGRFVGEAASGELWRTPPV